jgi:hypothetical protein
MTEQIAPKWRGIGAVQLAAKTARENPDVQSEIGLEMLIEGVSVTTGLDRESAQHLVEGALREGILRAWTSMNLPPSGSA